MDKTHANRHHLIFMVVVIWLIYIVLTSPLIGSGQANSKIAPTGEAIVCFKFSWQNQTRTCAATTGQTCGVCQAICHEKNGRA